MPLTAGLLYDVQLETTARSGIPLRELIGLLSYPDVYKQDSQNGDTKQGSVYWVTTVPIFTALGIVHKHHVDPDYLP